jgi:ABC-type molybdate transport system substrate-binding protein
VRVRGKGADSVTFTGRPIVYALSIPLSAPHRALAEQFVRYLRSAEGRRIMRAEGLDALEAPSVVGTGAPAGIAP